MSDKVYNGTIKAVKKGMQRNKGKRRVLLSITGIGDAFIMWDKTPKGVSFPVGSKIQVRMSKQTDGRWFVSEIVSIDGNKPKSDTQHNLVDKSHNHSKKKQGIVQKATSSAKRALSRLLTGQAGYMRKMYLYAMGGSNIDLGKLESRAESLAPYMSMLNWQKNHMRI